MDEAVALFDQVFPLAYEEVKVTEPPAHKTVELDVMTGAVGAPGSVKLPEMEFDAHPAPLVTTIV